MQLSESIIADTEKKLDLTEKQMTRIKAQGREVPQNIKDKMVREEKQLATQNKIALGHHRDDLITSLLMISPVRFGKIPLLSLKKGRKNNLRLTGFLMTFFIKIIYFL